MLLKENSQPEKATYCKILTIWYYGKGKTIEFGGGGEGISGFPSSGEGKQEWIGGAQGTFRVYESILCDTIMRSQTIMHLSKLQHKGLPS